MIPDLLGRYLRILGAPRRNPGPDPRDVTAEAIEHLRGLEAART